MDDVFTRRGFIRTAGVGLAALFVPSFASADQVLLLTPRWELAPQGLHVTLFLRASSGRAMELPAHAARVFVRVQPSTGRPTELELQSEGIASQRRSRAGHRLGRRVIIPESGELAYDSFTGEWPAGLSGRVTLTLRTELRDVADRSPEADRPVLAALSRLTGELTANLPR